ncbi:hypothetical protein AB0D66_06440 [Streptomyces sp. NPDC048270]|uniref:hypothetical protein n=1 Tax=Streptomyces sp. NPDC048270 TaxID=3154615 RepID=UPI00340BA69A
MRPAQASIAIVVTALAAAVALTGCTESEKAAAPRLPDRTCFGIFTPSDIEPLMGSGTTVNETAPVDIRLSAERRSATCNVDVDGQGRLLVSATRQPLGQHFTWPPGDPNQPAADPLPLGDKGTVWNTGARVALTCKGSTDSFELLLTIGGSVEHMKPGTSRSLFTTLMEKYLAAAKQQTGCGA